MKTVFFSLFFLLGVCLSVRADFTISVGGKARCAIIQQANATKPEINAAKELADTLAQITGGSFAVQTNIAEIPKHAIIVGPGAAATKYFPEIDLSKFGGEELIMRVKDGRLLLAGGRPRGTLYAANRFLQEQCSVRWWTPQTTNIPQHASLKIANLNVREKPAFEYRGPFLSAGFEPLWKSHNTANNENETIPAELGGSVIYKGFAHTFHHLVPPDKHFEAHPEWYSLIQGKRTYKNAQLCLSNPELRDFVVKRARQWLREAPNASIISITQNDCDGHCECPNCKAIDDAEGSHAGSMLDFVNYIAEKLEPEFPNVGVDTFAYQYTRKPPKTIKARSNVIVRLCSIECNFREPLDDASNAAFLDDLNRWSKICSHLYIWDYTIDFGNYICPFPNWFTVGANFRLFQKYGVRGVFEEGAYGGPGSDMAEMRVWMLAQLLWNSQQDDHALVKEFLTGYYGKAGQPIGQYLDLMYDKAKGFYLPCSARKDPPYLQFKTMAAAEKLWQQAEAVVAKEPTLLARVRLAHLSLRFVWLRDWKSLRWNCAEQNGVWPLSESRKVVADEWRSVAAGLPGEEWAHVRTLNEGGASVDDFLAKFATDPPEKNGPKPPKRIPAARGPNDLPGIRTRDCIDLQDNLATLYKPGELAEIRPDTAASDNRAVWMPGTHEEWAFQIRGTNLPPKALKGKWKVYAVLRVETTANAATDTFAFSAGIYDAKAQNHPTAIKVKIRDSGEGYHSHFLGTVEFNPDREIYIAPSANAEVKAIYVDRVYLVPAS